MNKNQPMIQNYAFRVQNSTENQKILNENLEKLNYQCRLVYNILKTGRKLTVGEAAIGIYDRWEKNKFVVIGDLRARVRDLRASFDIRDEKLPGGFKRYFIEN